MKITLISPKGPLYRHRGGIFKHSLRYQPLTLTSLAALAPPDLAVELSLIDEGITEVPDRLDADLVGMTVITGTATRAYQLADQYRQEGKTVVLGGPHVTLMPDEALAHADAVCVGYAEQTWPQLLYDFASGHMRKIYQQTPDFFLGERPFPRRELFDKRYFLTQAVFEASRSCIHDCEFCVAPTAWGRKPIQNPIDWIIEDIRRLGQKKIIFVDLNLVSDIRYARELFTRLIPLRIHWFGLSTVLIAHDHGLMELMAKSGCKGLLLGLETVTQGSLKDAGKVFNGSVNYQTLINDLHRLGIAIQGCFVFGLDHDTPDVFDATAHFVIEAGVDLPRFSVLTPFPGTPLYKRLEAEDRILTRNWELYDAQHVVFQPKNMTVAELMAGHKRVWQQVYRWPAIIRRLGKAKNLTPLALSANSGYRFYAWHLHRFYTCDWPINLHIPQPFSGMMAGKPQSANPSPTNNRTVCG